MSYQDIANMKDSNLLRRRLHAAAAQENKPEPVEQWVADNIWEIVSAPGWAAKWAYAEAIHEPQPGDPPYDPGGDEAVITDQDILSVIQPIP